MKIYLIFYEPLPDQIAVVEPPDLAYPPGPSTYQSIKSWNIVTPPNTVDTKKVRKVPSRTF